MDTRTDNSASAFLKNLYACDAAVQWVAENGYSLEEAWESCERGDWLLWFAAHIGVDCKLIVTAASPLNRAPEIIRKIINWRDVEKCLSTETGIDDLEAAEREAQRKREKGVYATHTMDREL